MADVTFRANFDDSQVQAGIKRNIEGVESLNDVWEQFAVENKALLADVTKSLAAIRKEEDLAKLRRTEQLGQLAKLKAIEQDVTRTNRERAKAAKESAAIETALLKEQIALVERELAIRKAQTAATKAGTEGRSRREREALEVQARLNELKGKQEEVDARLIRSQRQFSLAGQLSVKVMYALRAAIAATGIGLVVAAVAALGVRLAQVKPIADANKDAFAGLSRAFDVVIDRAVVFGKGLGLILSGNVKAGVESIRASFDNLTASLIAAGAAGTAASRALRAISEQEEDLALDIAQQSERLAKLKAVRDDDTKSIRERQAASRQASETEREFQVRNLQLLQERLAIANQEAAARKEQDKSLAGTNRLTKEQQELLIQIGQAQGKLAESDLDAARALASLRKEASAAAKARREELADLEKQAAAFLAQLEKLRAGQLSGIDRVRAERALAIKAINEQEAELRKVFAERRKEFTLEAEFEQARAIVSAQASKEIRGILLDEARERQAILEKTRQAENKALADSQKERLADIEIGKQILLARVDLIERAGETEEDFAIQIARRKLQIEINAQRERLEVVAAQYGENSPEVQLARAQIQLLEKEYQKAGEINVSGFQALKAKILSALGITEEEAGLVLQQAGDAISSIAGLVGAGTEAQLAQQDKLLDSIRSRISETEGLLREEQRRAEQGYANNALLFEESLKKQQEAEAAAEKERAKLQDQATKRQLKQNQLQAISEYGLLVIKLLSAEASKGIIGLAIGIAGLALVARIVAQQKTAAAKLLEPGFRHGTEFVDGPGNGRSDSIAARLSRGERVLPAIDNMEVGGRALSNKELVRLVKIGRLADIGSFAPANAQARQDAAAAAEMKVMVDMKVAEKAYREAAEAAAEKVVAAIDAKPTVIQAGNTAIVERKGGKKEIYVGQPAK